jgi:GNAT superfamily N-acetyltransferase
MLAEGVELRRPNSWEKRTLLDWVGATFSASWALEVEAAFAARPPTCFVAIRERTLVGFAVYDCTRLDFFGPTGVAPDARGRGIGVALLLTTLHAMRDAGYAYAIIGGVGPAEFYARAAGAIPIPGSTPGVYDFALVRRDAPDGS